MADSPQSGDGGHLLHLPQSSPGPALSLCGKAWGYQGPVEDVNCEECLALFEDTLDSIFGHMEAAIEGGILEGFDD